MSTTRKSIYAPQPHTLRATPTPLSVDPTGTRLAYTSGKSVFLRLIDDPSQCTQYTSHTFPATVARFSPSGYYVASGDASGMVRVWDAVGEEMRTKGEFPIISGPIRDLAWDAESKRLIAVGDGKERFGHCITSDTGNSVGTILGHSSAINSVSIRPVRPYRAVTASDDHTLVLFQGPPFKFDHSITNTHTNFVQSVSYSPCGSYFTSVGSDRKVFLYDGLTGDLVSEINTGHKGGIYGISWSSDSKRFATASADQTVKVWDVETSIVTDTWRFGTDGITTIGDQQVGVVWTHRADNLIISISLNGDLNYLTPGHATPTRIVTGHQKALTALTTTPDALFTGGADGRVMAWSASGNATPVSGPGHANPIVVLTPTPPTTNLASAAWDDHIRLISAPSKTFTSDSAPTPGQPKSLSPIGTDGSTITATESELTVFSPTLHPTASFKPKFTPTCLSASSTSRVAVGATNSSIHTFTSSPALTAGKMLPTRSTPTALSYSPDGSYLAAGDSAGKITLYEVGAGGEYTVKTTRWAFHTGRIEAIVWNAEGTHVVTGSLDTNVMVYSVQEPGKCLKILNAHMGGVTAVGWEEGGVVSVGADGCVKRWKAVLK